MRPVAVLADIHGNLEALDTVLAELKPLNPRAYLVLGDSFQTLAGVDKLAGKGVIAANSDVWAKLGSDLDGFAGTRLDLGNTAAGFRGVEFEAADNAAATAFEWDGETTYTGWLGIGDDVDFADDVDYIRLVAENESTLTIASSAWENGTGDIVRISGGNEIEITDGSLTYELVAGGEYIIEITRKDKDSMSYTMSIAQAMGQQAPVAESR